MGNKRVVIVGGDFGGLCAAKNLANRRVDVTLVDRKNHHTFQPLLYQVATAVLSAGEIAAPLRRILRRARNVEVLLDEVTDFDPPARRVVLRNDVELEYDYLIVAAGSRHSYFGHDEWEEVAPGLKTVEDAVAIRRRVLLAFEEAERQAYLGDRREPLTFAIIGGGATGVELAGAIAGIARFALAGDFKAIDTTQARVILFEGGSRVLNTYPEDLSRKAEQQLTELGVEVRKNSLVTSIEEGRIQVGGEWIPVSASIWATGPLGAKLAAKLGAPVDKYGRVLVEPDLSAPGRPEIFVIGDMASIKDAKGQPVPGLAAAAKQGGEATAANILRELKGEKRVPFTYRDRGNMATVGRNRAVAHFGRWHLSGIVAWFLWLVVHVFLLIGFRSRLWVMREWAWAYFTRERSARLITDLRPDAEVRPRPMPGVAGSITKP